MAPRASLKSYLRLVDAPERAAPRNVGTVDLMQACRGSAAAPSRRDRNAKPRKKAGRRAAAKPKPGPPRAKAD